MTPAQQPASVQSAFSTLALLAAMAMIATIPGETVVVIDQLGTLTRALGGIAVCSALLACISSNRMRRLSPAHWILLCYVFWNCITALWSPNPEATRIQLSRYGQSLLLVWIVFEQARTDVRRRALMASYVAGAAIAAVFVLKAYLEGNPLSSDRRYGAPGSDPNDLGLCLVLAVPLAGYLALKAQHLLSRSLAALSIPLLLVGISFTGSRGAMLALAACAAVSLAFCFKTGRVRGAAFIGLLAASAMVLVGMGSLPQTLVRRYADIPSELESGTMSNRLKLWSTSFDLITDRPLTGHGAGAFPTASGSHGGLPDVAHNTYLSVAAEQGAPGLFLLLSVVVAITLITRSAGPAAFHLWLITAAAWGVGIAGLTWEGAKATWFILGLFAGYSAPPRSAPLHSRWHVRPSHPSFLPAPRSTR